MTCLRQALSVAVGVGVVGVLVLGCSKKSVEATPAPTETTVSAATPDAAAPASPAPMPSPAPSSLGIGDQSIAGQLTIEKNKRTPGNPSVEQVFQLCEKLGAPVPNTEQTVGKTYKASYCIGGFTKDKKMSINVCEYPDEATLAAGVEQSNRLFKVLAPRRHVLSRRTTTLTLFEAQPGDDTHAMTKKLTDAFLAM